MENNRKYYSMEEIFRDIKWYNYVEINTKEEADLIRQFVKDIRKDFNDNTNKDTPESYNEYCNKLEILFAGISTEFGYGEVNVENDFLLSDIAVTIADMKREIITKKYKFPFSDVKSYQYDAKYWDIQKEKQTKLVKLEEMRKKGFNNIVANLELEIEDLDEQILENTRAKSAMVESYNDREYTTDTEGNFYKLNPTTKSYERVEQEEQYNRKYYSMEEIFRDIKWHNYVEINTKEEADLIREYVRDIRAAFDKDIGEYPVGDYCDLLDELFAGISTEFGYGEVNVENDYLLSDIASTIADMKREIITKKSKCPLSEQEVIKYQYEIKYWDIQKEKQTKLVKLEEMRKKGYNNIAANLELEIEDLDEQILENTRAKSAMVESYNDREYTTDTEGNFYKLNPTTNSYEYVEQEEQLEGKFRK